MSKINELAEFLDVDVEDLEESRYSDSVFVVNPRRVKDGHPPEYYTATIEKFKALLTPLKIQQITDYITGNFWSEKSRDKLYYPINRYLKKYKQDKPEYAEIKKDCLYVENVLYHLLSNEDKDYIRMYKNAFLGKPLTDNRKLVERNDGEYLVLTEVEAEIRAMDHLTDEDYFWKQAVQAGHTTQGLEDWAQEVIDIDGLGHILSSYDGGEEETDNYLVFRTN